MDCPFCNIEKEKSRIIKTGNSVFVVLSNPRLMPGHLLVVPKRHVEKLSELKEGEKKELLETVLEFQEKILSNLTSGCDIRQNCRPFLKQSRVKVNHLHFHLQPREFKDELYRVSQIHETDLFKELSEKERTKFIQLFREQQS